MGTQGGRILRASKSIQFTCEIYREKSKLVLNNAMFVRGNAAKKKVKLTHSPLSKMKSIREYKVSILTSFIHGHAAT